MGIEKYDGYDCDGAMIGDRISCDCEKEGLVLRLGVFQSLLDCFVARPLAVWQPRSLLVATADGGEFLCPCGR